MAIDRSSVYHTMLYALNGWLLILCHKSMRRAFLKKKQIAEKLLILDARNTLSN